MSANIAHLSQALHTDGFVAGFIDDELDEALTQSAEWKAFADSWNRLPVDPFMADGGTYRLRRFSEFRCGPGFAVRLTRRPFSQPLEINYLNGGVERLFEPIEDATASSPVLHSILHWCTAAFCELHGPSTWRAQCFQNRTLARPGIPGLPTPEGIHRDGVDYNVVVLVGRTGVHGGTSILHDPETREPFFETVLREPGAFLLNDDRRTLHSATAVIQSGEAVGNRDVFIVSFVNDPAGSPDAPERRSDAEAG